MTRQRGDPWRAARPVNEQRSLNRTLSQSLHGYTFGDRCECRNEWMPRSMTTSAVWFPPHRSVPSMRVQIDADDALPNRGPVRVKDPKSHIRWRVEQCGGPPGEAVSLESEYAGRHGRRRRPDLYGHFDGTGCAVVTAAQLDAQSGGRLRQLDRRRRWCTRRWCTRTAPGTTCSQPARPPRPTQRSKKTACACDSVSVEGARGGSDR